MTREQFITHAEGCQKAFRRFLTALCCGDSQLADDIAQDSLMKAYLSCDGFNTPAKFTAWIYRIGVNTFISHKRAERITADYDEARGLSSPETADGQFRYQALYAALDKLNSRERSAILLFYMEGYAIKEIAEMTEASVEAVKQYLSRGRNHLRAFLESPQTNDYGRR